MDIGNKMIAIPSRGRAHLIRDKRHLFQYVGESIFNRTPPIHLFVPKSEHKDYYDAIYSSGLGEIITLVIVPDSSSITEARQCILDHAEINELEKVLMIDDDIWFRPYNPVYTSKYAVGCIPKEDIFINLVEQIFSMTCDEYPMNGFINSLGCQDNKEMFSVNKKLGGCYCLHVPTFVKEEIRFDDMKVSEDEKIFMEDYYVQLSLRSKGYHVLSNNNIALNSPGRGDLDGGCDDGGQRCPKTQSESARRLKASFPDYVQVVQKEKNSQWEYAREDVRINMKQLIEDKCPKFPGKQHVIETMRHNGYKETMFMYPKYKEFKC